MGAAARIMKAVAREFPDAVVDQSSGVNWAIRADDNPHITKEERRRRIREGRRG
jgi:hypothetical protein